MLRSGENVFLDDITTDDVCEQLRVPLRVVKPGGQELLDALLGRTPDEADTEYPGYEMRE